MAGRRAAHGRGLPPRCPIRHPSSNAVWRLAVAVVLTAVVIWRVSPAALVASLARTEIGWVVAAIALVLVDRFLNAYRWLVLLRTLEPADRPATGDALRVFFISTFVGGALPSVGGDAVRAYGLARVRVSPAAAVASVLMDRLIGVLSLLLVILAGLAFAVDLLHERAVIAILMAMGAASGFGLAMIYSSAAAQQAARLLGRLPMAAARRLAVGIPAAVRAYATHHAALANVLAGSVIVQILRVGQAYLLGRGLGIDAAWLVYFAFIPIILLVMLVPLGFHGFGPSQVAFPLLFARAGVPHGEAVALSLLFAGLGVVGNLPGAVLLLRRGTPGTAGTPGT